MGTKHVVPRAEGQGGIGTATLGWGELFITNTTNDSATQGGKLTLTSNDGDAMQSGSRLGVIEFKGAESSSALTIGARIEAICDAAWTATENGASLKFYTTNDNATESLVLTLDSNKLAVFTGAVAINGDLTVNGTQTTVNSQTVTIDDPVFTLGGDTDHTSDDNKDRGIEFRYYSGSAKLGFFGWDDSASAFTFIADASNSGETFSGSAGNAIFGNLNLGGTLTLPSQTANRFFVAPNGSNGVPTFRVIAAADIPNDTIDSQHYAAGSIDNEHLAANSVNSDNYVDLSIDTDHIGNDQVTYAKIQNVSATNIILGRDSAGAGIIEEISPASLRTMINVADGANNYSLPFTDNSSNWNTAYGWGNHASAGYITSADGGNAGTLDGIDSSSFLRSDTGDTMSGVLTMNNRLHIIGQNSIWLASNNTAKINIDARSTGDGAQLYKWNRNYQDTAYLTYYEQWYDGDSYHSIGVSGDRWKLSDGLDVSGTITGTNLVYTDGNQTIGGVKTFSSAVNVTSADDTRLKLTDTGNSSELIFRSDGANTQIYTNTAHDLGIYTANNVGQLHLKQSNGNVGIGTSSPDKQLTFIVKNDDAIQIRRYTTGQGAPAVGTGISWTWTSSGTDTQTWAAIRTIMPGNGNTHMTFSTKVGSDSTATEKMRVTDGGNVGIGTTSPFNTTNNTGLNVDTGGHSSIMIGDGINDGGMIQSSDNSQRIIIGANVYDDPSSSWQRWNASGAALVDVYGEGGAAFISLNVDNGSSGYPSSKLFVKGDGNVGIGTTSPTSTLHVVGTVNVTSTKNFYIDHPLESKKDTHSLIHASVESPEVNNLYRGKVDLVNGNATVNLDTVSSMTEGTFVALNNNAQCFTTNESDWDAVKGDVVGNELTISCQNSSSTANVSWMVIANRKDIAIIESSGTDSNGKLIVEEVKVQDP